MGRGVRVWDTMAASLSQPYCDPAHPLPALCVCVEGEGPLLYNPRPRPALSLHSEWATWGLPDPKLLTRGPA